MLFIANWKSMKRTNPLAENLLMAVLALQAGTTWHQVIRCVL